MIMPILKPNTFLRTNASRYVIGLYIKRNCYIVRLDMTVVIQHNKALGTTTSRAICDVNGNDYYFMPLEET